MQLQVNMWTAFAGRMGIAALLATTLCGVALASGADRAREIELRQLVSGTSYASIRVQLPSGKQRRLVIYGAAAPLVLSAISIDDFGARGYPSVLTIEEARRILAAPVKLKREDVRLQFDTPRPELCGLGGLVNEESKIDVLWANAPQPHVALSKYFTRLPAGSDGDRFLLKDEYVSRVTCGDIDYLLRNQLLVRRGPNWRSLVVVDPNAVLPSQEGSRH